LPFGILVEIHIALRKLRLIRTMESKLCGSYMFVVLCLFCWYVLKIDESLERGNDESLERGMILKKI
jgi:hypothetical protein